MKVIHGLLEEIVTFTETWVFVIFSGFLAITNGNLSQLNSWVGLS